MKMLLLRLIQVRKLDLVEVEQMKNISTWETYITTQIKSTHYYYSLNDRKYPNIKGKKQKYGRISNKKATVYP